MIRINGAEVTSLPPMEGFSPDALQQDILAAMMRSREVYAYGDIRELIAELKLRRSVVAASWGLARSGIRFKVFRDSFANPDYWRRTLNGGFQLRGDVRPSDAIRDIYRNGPQYGTECATAMIIVLYKALLDVMPEEEFNRLYSDIYLMDWAYLDRDLALTDVIDAADLLPGDARYFKNPDVNPVTPEWQGENAYYLGGGQYYGHGVGVADADGIIGALNRQRKEGATQSAYLTNSTKRQNYKWLAKYIV